MGVRCSQGGRWRAPLWRESRRERAAAFAVITVDNQALLFKQLDELRPRTPPPTKTKRFPVQCDRLLNARHRPAKTSSGVRLSERDSA